MRIGSAPARLALLGTGTVGCAVVARWQQLRARGVSVPTFAWVSNSRVQLPAGEALGSVLDEAREAQRPNSAVPPWADAESLRPGDVVIDATASGLVADWHREWLSRGIHVVTANKLGMGTELARAQAILDAQRSGARYGDSATVGAGLPLLRSIRELVAGGDRIHAVEGILSGSLAWLFSHHDGKRPFSELVRQARDAGFTEPDPRQDLSGDDVRRKLLILARAANLLLQEDQVRVESLLPDTLRNASPTEVDGLLSELDVPLAETLAQAKCSGDALCFVGRFSADGHASLGLRSLSATHPLASGQGTDNKVAIFSDRYREQPLVIQGPGAGAEVTAAALLDDVLRIVNA